MKDFITPLTILLLGIALSTATAQTTHGCICTNDCDLECDSLNIPVFIVDGIEMQNIDSISPNDIVKMEVVKDPNITRIFKPRLGGVVMITTKSKQNLRKVIKDYKAAVAQRDKNRTPGELRIR